MGGKYWLKDDLALQAGITITDQSAKTEQPSTKDYAELHNDNTNIITAIELEKHFKSTKKFLPYFGGIAGFAVDRYQYKEDRDNIFQTSHTKYQYFTGILLGVEYWITKSISLSGTHYLKLYYSHQTDKNSSGDDKHVLQKRTAIDINSSTSSLMISVYF